MFTETKTWVGLVGVGILSFSALKVGKVIGGRIEPKPKIIPLRARSSTEAAMLRRALSYQGQAPLLVEFLDPECPACKKSWPLVKEALDRNPQVGFRPLFFPLPMHPHARQASVAERALEGANHESSVMDRFMSGSVSLDKNSLEKLLLKEGLMKGWKSTAALQADEAVTVEENLALTMHVSGTPTYLLLNGSALSEVRSAFELDQVLSSIRPAH